MTKEIIEFLLKSGLVMSVLYIIYYFIFRNETFHNLNRIYLLSSLIISVIIPFINFSPDFSESFTNAYKVEVIEKSINNIALTISEGSHSATDSSIKFLWQDYLVIGYILVIISLLISYFKDLFRMISFRKSYGIQKDGRYKIINTPGIITAFSFFNIIFIDQTNLEEDEVRGIIEHEKVHSGYLHTIDLILVQIFILFYWFNPFIYLIRNSLREVHEYQADDEISSTMNDITDYQKLLIKRVDLKGSLTFTSNFNSLTLKRIKMMTKAKSSPMKLYNVVLIPFVVALLLITLSSNKTIENLPGISLVKDTCIVLDSNDSLNYTLSESSTVMIDYKTGRIVSKPHIIMKNDIITYSADSVIFIDGKTMLCGNVTVTYNSDTMDRTESLKLKRNEIFGSLSEEEIKYIPNIFPADREKIISSYIEISFNPNATDGKKGTESECYELEDKGNIYSTADGKVISVEENSENETVKVTIDHLNGYVTGYDDLNDSSVKEGDDISKGQKIGAAGTTELIPNFHVIYEITKDGDSMIIDHYLPE